MIPCRLCTLTSPHVHTGNQISPIEPAIPENIKIDKISNLDWGMPAIKYRGKWYRVTVEFVERLWPLIKPNVDHLVENPAVEDDETRDQDDDSD